MTNALILSLFGMIFSLIGFRTYLKRKEVRRIGRPAQGKIVNDVVNFNGSSTPTRTPVIRFIAADGMTVTGKPQYHMSTSFSSIGESVNVLHDPKDPSRFIVDDPWQQRFNYGFIGLGLIFLVAGVYNLMTSGSQIG